MGRMCTLMKRMAASLAYLEQVISIFYCNVLSQSLVFVGILLGKREGCAPHEEDAASLAYQEQVLLETFSFCYLFVGFAG